MRAALLLAFAIVAAACTSSAELATIEPVTEPAAQQVEFVVESGLDAIAEAQGTPHILWFWGAY